MKNKIFIFITFLTIFIGINSVKAVNFYETEFVVDDKNIKLTCDINNNIFSINGSSNYEKLSINDMYKINFSIDDKDYGILIDSIIIENYENGNCLDKLIFSDKISKPGSSTLGTLIYQEKSTATCTYKKEDSDTISYTVNINGDELTLTGPESGNVKHVEQLSIIDFKNEKGELICSNQLIAKYKNSGAITTLYITTDGESEGAGGVTYLLHTSDIVNVPNTIEEELLRCVYDNNSIIRTSSGLKYDFYESSDYKMKYNFDENEFLTNCPEKIYILCQSSVEKTCEVSLKSLGYDTEVKLDTDKSIYSNFQYLLGGLKNPLSLIDTNNLYDDYSFKISENEMDNIKLSSIENNNSICELEKCKENPKGYLKAALINLKTYCNAKSENPYECISFDNFYEKIVEENLIEDLSSGCGFISDELYEKLDYILDIIKIAAPLLAIGLGMLDFVKVIAAGDADKEMKAAFNRFSRRLIAAALLFIIPSVLSLILNIFLHNEPGYDEDNPFCNLVDYESKNNN